jgi:cell division protease FtsH
LLVRNRVLLEKLSKELIEYETVDAKHLIRLIEEYAVDEIHIKGPSRNGHPDGHRE